MLNKKEKAILDYTKKKVVDFFSDYDTPAHGIDHVLRVAAWAALISRKEKADEFICSLAAILHDVGRTKESRGSGSLHHELSYKICREWFNQDKILKRLPKQKKLELLYAIRYHWNNAADKYFSAIILRDADKLDALGRIGLKRALEFYETEGELLNGFRYITAYLYQFVTDTAKDIVRKTKLEKPLLDYERKLLRKKITKIEL